MHFKHHSCKERNVNSPLVGIKEKEFLTEWAFVTNAIMHTPIQAEEKNFKQTTKLGPVDQNA